MKDAFSGIYNIIFVVVFLVIIMGIFGFLVSYTKAFKMKNFVLSAVEQYDGYWCDRDTSDCFSKIKENADNIGYKPTELRCSTVEGVEMVKVGDLYCLGKSHVGDKYVYKVVTQVDINIPIINKIMGLEIFQVSGDTDIIYKK